MEINSNAYITALIRPKFRLAIVILLSVLVNSLIFIAQWYALSPKGSGTYLNYSALFIIPLTLVMMAIPLLIIMLAFPVNKKKVLFTLLCCMIYIGTGFFSTKLSVMYRGSAFDKLAQQSQQLVAAIAQYEKDHHYPPQKLKLLVPEYLPNVHNTGMGAYPDYTYKVIENPGNQDVRRWQLYVTISGVEDNGDSEKFFYLPERDAPDALRENIKKRSGDWVYLIGKRESISR